MSVCGPYSRGIQRGENSIRTIHKNLRKAAVNKLAILLKGYTAFCNIPYLKSCILLKANNGTPGNKKIEK